MRDISEFKNVQFLLDLEKNLINLLDIQHTFVNKSMTAFINIFETTLQLCAPLCSITCKEKNLKKPWITKRITGCSKMVDPILNTHISETT